MFEEVMQRIEPSKDKAQAKVKFAKSSSDSAPRLIVSLTAEAVKEWPHGTSCALAIGRDEDLGKILITFGSGSTIATVRRMKLGGAIIDFGVVAAGNTLWKIDRPLPIKSATIINRTSNKLMLQLPVWDAHETVQSRKVKAKPAGYPPKAVVGMPAPVKGAEPGSLNVPLCTVNPPAIVFNGKRAALTPYQAVLLCEMVRRFNAVTAPDVLIREGYKNAQLKAPSGAEAILPQTLAAAKPRLVEIGLNVNYVRGQGWGLSYWK